MSRATLAVDMWWMIGPASALQRSVYFRSAARCAAISRRALAGSCRDDPDVVEEPAAQREYPALDLAAVRAGDDGLPGPDVRRGGEVGHQHARRDADLRVHDPGTAQDVGNGRRRCHGAL